MEMKYDTFMIWTELVVPNLKDDRSGVSTASIESGFTLDTLSSFFVISKELATYAVIPRVEVSPGKVGNTMCRLKSWHNWSQKKMK